MKNQSAAQKAQEKNLPALQIVKPTEEKTHIPFTTEPKGENKDQEAKPAEVEKKIPTLQDLKNRATVLHLLNERHTKLTDKRSSLDKFELKHDENNATITVTDATGEEFTSNSPKSVAQLIEFWKCEFDEAIEAIEQKMAETFAA